MKFTIYVRSWLKPERLGWQSLKLRGSEWLILILELEKATRASVKVASISPHSMATVVTKRALHCCRRGFGLGPGDCVQGFFAACPSFHRGKSRGPASEHAGTVPHTTAIHLTGRRQLSGWHVDPGTSRGNGLHEVSAITLM